MKANHGLNLTVLVVLVFIIGLLGSSVKADFGFGKPQNLGPVVNTALRDATDCTSADNLNLYFGSNRTGGLGGWDLCVSTR